VSDIPSDLPPRLSGTDPDSFVHHTVTVRWPRIARRVIEETDYGAATTQRLQALIDEIPEGPIRRLDPPSAPDAALWNARIAPYRGQSWLACPWFFGETYFYRRIVEAIGYFGPGARSDPFATQKQTGYAESLHDIRTLAHARAEAIGAGHPREELVRLLKTALWGNQADLSMWDAEADGPDHLGTGEGKEHLLADDTGAVLDYLEPLDSPRRVDVWLDNAGFELATDLALADGLLAGDWVDDLVLHAKAHPTFVSDATIGDVHATLDALAADDAAPTRALAGRLRTALTDGRLRLADPFAWTSPLPAREFPATVTAELARTDLLLSKGDANYRRLLGDRAWPFTTPFEEVVSYRPAPVLALRTLKAEVAAGLTPKQVDRLDREDPNWLVDGEWGVIQFAGP